MGGWFDIGQLAGLKGVYKSRFPADSAARCTEFKN